MVLQQPDLVATGNQVGSMLPLVHHKVRRQLCMVMSLGTRLLGAEQSRMLEAQRA